MADEMAFGFRRFKDLDLAVGTFLTNFLFLVSAVLKAASDDNGCCK